jgi:LPS O-antigen subunit length determinant protein (WzzB/FepE family)
MKNNFVKIIKKYFGKNNKTMRNLKKILSSVHRGKVLILLGAISFTYFAYSINA